MAGKTRKMVVASSPEPVWEPIQQVRRIRDRRFARRTLRVSLICPFRPAPEFADLTRPLAAACRRVPPFAVPGASYTSPASV